MRLNTDVSFGQKEWEILHTYDESLIEQECYLNRMAGNNGFSKDRSHRSIAKIPRHRFFSDLELIKYMQVRGINNDEAKHLLDLWLLKNPQFKTCTGGI